MTFRVYEEDLDDVRDEATRLLSETRDQPQHPERFDWLYRRNPDGEAVCWSIRNTTQGEMAGFTVALPRRMRVDGQDVKCWNTADFSILKKYRSLGVALKLRRAAREAVDAGRVDFLYAHPNQRMQVLHERIGHRPVGAMVRYACPVQSTPYLQRRLPGKIAPALVAPFANMLLRWKQRSWTFRPRYETVTVDKIIFDESFDALFERVTQYPVLGIRDAAYLRWRYADNPLYDTHAILVRDQGHLIGYALFIVADGVLHVKDVFWSGNDVLVETLVWSLLVQARKRNACSVSFAGLEGHPIFDTLTKFGFSMRSGSSQMFAYAPDASDAARFVFDRKNWLLAVGDRDV